MRHILIEHLQQQEIYVPNDIKIRIVVFRMVYYYMVQMLWENPV